MTFAVVLLVRIGLGLLLLFAAQVASRYWLGRWVFSLGAGMVACVFVGFLVGAVLERTFAPPGGAVPIPIHGMMAGAGTGALAGIAVGFAAKSRPRLYWILQFTAVGLAVLTRLADW